jgi:glycosyltransferase involved in cell wall biosynthesis
MKSINEPSVLLLIPAYNEEARIAPVLEEYAQYFRKSYTGSFSLLVVLNGCRDNTIGVVQAAHAKYPEVRYMNFDEPIGKGGALIEGLKYYHEADYIGYVDADGATGPAAFHDLIRHCREADCVFGSRWLPNSVIHQSQESKRQFASRCFHLIVQTLFWMNIKDTQCGAKLIRREAAEAVQKQLTIADMAFDINLLYALKKKGFTLKEIPTEWTDKIGTKVVLGRTSLTMLLSVIRLRVIYSPFFKPFRFILTPISTYLYKKLAAPHRDYKGDEK